MIDIIRKNQRALMIIISVLVIISFVWLYNQTDLQKLGQTSVGQIYGRKVSGTEFERTARQAQVAYSMGLLDLLQALSPRGSQDEFVWNTIVLRHAASQLQVDPGVEAVQKRIQSLPAFQTDGKFDLVKYNKFIAETLTPNGYTSQQMEDLVRDDLRLARLKDIIGSTVAVADDEVRYEYARASGKRHLWVVRLNRDEFAKSAAVTPEEIRDWFEKNKSSYKTEEKRVVKYVVFGLPDKDKSLQGKERVAALQPISDKADQFTQKMLVTGAKFEEVAKNLGVEVKTTAPFTQSNPPAEVAGVPGFGATAFSLTGESADSDIVQTEDAFYVLHLEKIEPSQPETLEQATPRIASLLEGRKIQDTMSKRAADLKVKLATAIKNGKTFAQAAEAEGLKVEALPPLAPAELRDAQDSNQMLQFRAADLTPGSISDFIDAPTGGALAFLEKVDPIDESQWNERKKDVLALFQDGKRMVVFGEWLRGQRNAANLRVGAGNPG